jgi:hypothetical protein
MSKKQDDFGYKTGKIKYKDPATRFKGVGRQDDPLPDNHNADDYPDVRVEKSHHGAMDITNYIPGKEYRERWDANGNHTIDYDDGSRAVGVTGTSVTKVTQGEISTVQYSGDKFTYNHSRQGSGNLDNQPGLIKGGGSYHECGGHMVEAIGGMKTTATMMASGEGEYHLGKKTINAEGGVGIGVNKSSDMKVWTRWEPDGTFHIQVKPKGAEGGNATVKILPSGEIIITTVKSMIVTADEKVTIIGKKGILLKSGGDIITDGKTTKIQKGGPVEDPRTFV